MKYGFIGFGNMAQAIYKGLKHDSSLEFAYVNKGAIHDEIKMFNDIKSIVAFSDVVWVCVKPQNITEVLDEMKSCDLKNKIIVTPVAGKNISFFEKYLGANTKIIRIMPNLAIAYGKSVTAFCVNGENTKITEKIKDDLKKLGEVLEIGEDKFDLFTAIFGSGPAFILEIFNSFKNKMADLEISPSVQNELLTVLVQGTVTYFYENKDEKSIAELIEKITSRAGVTEAGLKFLRENKVGELFEGVIESAKKRSEELSK